MSIVINPTNGYSTKKAVISVASNSGATLMCDNQIYQLSNYETEHSFIVDVKKSANPNYRNLPSGYKQLDWIENLNGAYIDFDFIFGENWRFQAKVSFTNLSFTDIEGKQYISLCGGTSSTECNGEFSYIHEYHAADEEAGTAETSTYNWNNFYPSNLFTWENNFTLNTPYIITSKKNHLSMNKNRIGYTDTITSCGGNFSLFSSHSHSSNNFNGKIYYFKIKNEYNELVYDLVPCKRSSDSTIGLYDLINNKFISSSNKKVFSAGTETSSEDYHYYKIKALQGKVIHSQNVYVSSYKEYKISLSTNAIWNVFTAGSSNAGYSSGTYLKVDDTTYENIGIYSVDPNKTFILYAKGSSNPEWYYGGSERIWVYYNNITCLKQTDGGYDNIWSDLAQDFDIYFCYKGYGSVTHIARIFDIYDFDLNSGG